MCAAMCEMQSCLPGLLALRCARDCGAALSNICLAPQCSADAAAWRDLVPLCRALRETLTSLRELSHFTREVRVRVRLC